MIFNKKVLLIITFIFFSFFLKTNSYGAITYSRNPEDILINIPNTATSSEVIFNILITDFCDEIIGGPCDETSNYWKLEIIGQNHIFGSFPPSILGTCYASSTTNITETISIPLDHYIAVTGYYYPNLSDCQDSINGSGFNTGLEGDGQAVSFSVMYYNIIMSPQTDFVLQLLMEAIIVFSGMLSAYWFIRKIQK